jgi:hypothetical protein
MDEEIERLLVSVRADTGAFARDVADMRGQLEGPLAQGLERAGRVLENALLRAVRTGKLGFDDLKRVALSAMAEIAAAAIRSGIGAIGGGKGGTSGLMAGAAQALGAPLGLPGRALGGPVSPGRPYLVGERGRSCSCRPRADESRRAAERLELACSGIVVGGERVVGARQPAVPSPSGGTVIDVEARAALAALTAALMSHGLID